MAPPISGADSAVVDSMLPLRPLIQPPSDNNPVALPLNGALNANNLKAGLAAAQRADMKKQQQQQQQKKRQQNPQQSTKQAKVAVPPPSKNINKRRKLQAKNNKPKPEPNEPKASLRHLALETLDFILSYLSTEGLATMLSVNRHFKSYLEDPGQSSRVWRHARENILPRPLPPPPAGISENDYGRWIFGWLPCEICRKPTNRAPASISLRAKLCLNPECGKKWAATLVPASSNHIIFYQAMPFLEQQLDNNKFERIRHLTLWRRLKATRNTRLLRPTDIEDMRDKYIADEQSLGYLEAMNKWTALAQSVPDRVKSYEQVIFWAADFELHMRKTRKANDKLMREEARKHGWENCNIYNTEALLSVVRIANASGESVQPFLERSTVILDADTEVKKLAASRANRQQAKDQNRTLTEMVRLHKTVVGAAEKSSAATPAPPLAAFKNLTSVNSVVQTGNFVRTITKRGEEANETRLRIVQEVERWQDSALDMFAELLPNEAHEHVKLAPAMARIKPASRLNALFRCIHCTKTEAELRTHKPFKTLGKNAGAWRAMTIAQASQHECSGAAKSKNSPGRQAERHLAEPTYGLACDEEACLAVTSALAAADANVATVGAQEVEALGPVFRCCAEGCGLTMMFSRVKYHVLRHGTKVEFDCLDGPGPKSRPAKVEDFYDANGKPSGVWSDASKKEFECRHCDAKPFNARAIRQHVHDRHAIDFDSFASEDFSHVVDITAMLLG